MVGAITTSEGRWFQGLTNLMTRHFFHESNGVIKRFSGMDSHILSNDFTGLYPISAQPTPPNQKVFESIQLLQEAGVSYPRYTFSGHLWIFSNLVKLRLMWVPTFAHYLFEVKTKNSGVEGEAYLREEGP